MIKAECDRCGTQEQTPGSQVSIFGPMSKTKLPDGWRRVGIPEPDPAVQGDVKELCPRCLDALRKFFEGDGAVPGLLEPEALEDVFRDAVRAGRNGCIAHGGPDCICPPQTCLDGKHITTEETHPRCVRCGASPFDAEADPRPNLTERARKIAAGELCVCAGVGFGTEDCPAHHPNGVAEGTHLPCQLNENGDCPGIFRRGMFPEHMERWHKVKVSERSRPCPYCPAFFDGIMLTGQHIAKEHPGDWQAWIDGGQNAG